MVEIIDVGVDACGILSRSVGQTNQEVEIWRTFGIQNAKINGKRRQIAKILHSNRKEGSIPEDWKSSVVLPIYKGKGDPTEGSNCWNML